MTNTITRKGEGLAPSPVPSTDRLPGGEIIPNVDAPTRSEWKRAMYTAQGGRCWYCNCVMEWFQPGLYVTTPPDFATFEHLIPVRRRVRNEKGSTIGYHPDTPGYLLSRDNLVLACHKCNTTRGTHPLPDFIASLRERGKRFGIVSRIKHLVDDHMPQPWQAEAFASWMQDLLDRPASPAEALKRLPPKLEVVLLPDPAPPVPPVSRLVRLLRTWRRRLSLVLPLGRREGFKAGVALMAKYMAPGAE